MASMPVSWVEFTVRFPWRLYAFRRGNHFCVQISDEAEDSDSTMIVVKNEVTKGDKKGALQNYETALQKAPAAQKTRIEGLIQNL